MKSLHSLACKVVNVRPPTLTELPALLNLMRQLADFEDYLDDFSVTVDDLRERMLSENPQCYCLVVSGSEGDLLGYAVWLLVPFTYDLTPSAILKELYLVPQARGQGLGRHLFKAVQEQVYQQGCRRLLWNVLNGNQAAQGFYQRLGGHPEKKWQAWRKILSA